jgi:methionyl aminopeptidase
MNVTVKTPAEQDKMRAAGRLAASVLDMIEPFVQPGVTTEELDKRCHDFIVDELKSIPANLNYRGFPKTICTSVNHVVCHGIPGDKRLKSGDIINIDVTVIRDGFHGDTSRMYLVGTPSVLARRLTRACHEAMWQGIRVVKPGARWATSATPSRPLPRATASPWCASTAGTASAACIMRIRRCCTTANRGRASSS